MGRRETKTPSMPIPPPPLSLSLSLSLFLAQIVVTRQGDSRRTRWRREPKGRPSSRASIWKQKFLTEYQPSEPPRNGAELPGPPARPTQMPFLPKIIRKSLRDFRRFLLRLFPRRVSSARPSVQPSAFHVPVSSLGWRAATEITINGEKEGRKITAPPPKILGG